MIASAVHRASGIFNVRIRAEALPFLILALALLAYVFLRGLLIAVAGTSPQNSLILTTAACLAAVAFAGYRYTEIAILPRCLLRVIGGVVAVQMAFDASTLLYASDVVLTGAAGGFFALGTVLALVAAVCAWWRPSFLVPLFFHYVAFRHQINVATGVAVSETDYLSMLDIALFLAVGLLLTAALVRSLSRPEGDSIDAAWLRTRAGGLIWAWAVGAHLGNYFISGWTKVRAGGSDPFFWLTHNPTQTSILIGLERGDNPLAASPSLVQASWDGIVAGGAALNLFVLGVQLAAPLAIAHRRLLMVFTLVFDLFHVAVYATLGALFHFWIAVNVAIFLSARRVEDKAITPGMQTVAILAVLTAHFAFYTSHLGWLDTAKLASPSLAAETRDGRIVPVPSVFFGLMSYSIAQTAMHVPDGHFPMRLGGNTYTPEEWHRAQSCDGGRVAAQDTGVSLQTVEAMVRGNDAAMRRHPIVKDANLYYLYPHHMVANPIMFSAFNRLSMDDILRYHYSVESVCLSLHGGRLVRDVRFKTDHVIDAQR